MNGQLYCLVTYRNGVKDGPYLSYRQFIRDNNTVQTTSEIESIGQYLDDQQHGVWTEFVYGRKQVNLYDHGKLLESKLAE